MTADPKPEPRHVANSREWADLARAEAAEARVAELETALKAERHRAVEAETRLIRALTTTTTEKRTAHVYCGNNTRYRGMFEEPEECSYEGDVPLSDDPVEDSMATWVCPGCGVTNTIADHSTATTTTEAASKRTGWRDSYPTELHP